MISNIDTFRNFYLIMKIKPQVSYMCHLKMISNKHFKMLRILHFLRENIYLPYMRFVQKIPI